MTRPALLFVCLGNICRSPMAEGAMRLAAEEAGLDIEIDSAGTAAYHIGSAPDERAQAAAWRNGADISGLSGRQAVEGDFRRFTHIFALDGSNLANVRQLAPSDSSAELGLLMDYVPGFEGQAVADPYYGDDAGFEITWNEVNAAAKALVAKFQA